MSKRIYALIVNSYGHTNIACISEKLCSICEKYKEEKNLGDFNPSFEIWENGKRISHISRENPVCDSINLECKRLKLYNKKGEKE